MVWSPFQVHVIPYRHNRSELQYAVFRRADSEYWQGVAGGGEDGETPLDAAQRETYEECGIPNEATYIKLDSITSIPVYFFRASPHWGEDVYVIPQYAFGVDASGYDLKLSFEHTDYRWLPYEQARDLLYWHNNKTDLWELNQRLKGKGPRE